MAAKKKGSKGKKKRTMSAKQKAALAKGRAKAARMRREEEEALENKPRKKGKKKKAAKKGKKKAARKGKRKSKRGSTRTVHAGGKKVIQHTIKLPGGPQVIALQLTEKPKKRRKGKYKGSPTRGIGGGRLDNPTGLATTSYGGMFHNAGPYTAHGLKRYGTAVGGIAFGFIFTDALDRYLATRTPADSKQAGPDGTQKATGPLYGAAAAAAIMRRPDAVRMGAQGVTALVAMGGAYLVRGRPILPWALGGLAIGAGLKLATMLWNWQVAPRIFKVTDWSKPSLGSRLYGVEQIDDQDKTDALFENWANVQTLLLAQKNPPQLSSPMAAGTAPEGRTEGHAFGLGKQGEAGAPPLSGPPSRFFVSEPGRVGKAACTGCGGMGGCWSDCPERCNTCPEGSGIPQGGGGGGGGYGRRCAYVVQSGDDVTALVAQAGISVNDIAALNGGGMPTEWWVPGREVVLPESACRVVRSQQPSQPTPTPARPQQPTPTPPFTATPAYPRAPSPPQAVTMVNVVRDDPASRLGEIEKNQRALINIGGRDEEVDERP